MLHIVLTCIRQESANKWYCNTIKDLLLPNTVNQKGAKPYTAGLDDTTIPHIKIKNTEILLEKSSIPQYRKPQCPHYKESFLFFTHLQKICGNVNLFPSENRFYSTTQLHQKNCFTIPIIIVNIDEVTFPFFLQKFFLGIFTFQKLTFRITIPFIHNVPLTS